MNYRIFPPEEMIECTLDMPLSKSVSNRALIINAISGAQAPDRLADCADTSALAEALFSGGACSEINVGDSGTAMRFLCAFLAASPGRTVILDGSDRMRQRPIGPLVEALRTMGASIDYLGKEGFPPLRIMGTALGGGTVNIDAGISSQFVSALLLVAPTASSELTVRLDGDVVSGSYVAMTVNMMRRHGIDVDVSPCEIVVTPGAYTPVEDVDEGDWSAASYWYETAALSAGWLELKGLRQDSIQGDRRVAEIFDTLCVSTQWEDGVAQLIPSPEQAPRLNMDFTDNPDLAQTLAVTCCMLNIPFRFTGLETLRIKETDRLEALRLELLKISFIVNVESNGILSWEGQRVPVRSVPSVDTHGDHRMAMSFAPVSIFCPGIEICGAEVVDKSYPEFWNDLRAAGFTVVDSENIPDELRQMLQDQ